MVFHILRFATLTCLLHITGWVFAAAFPITILDLRDDTVIGAWQPTVAALGDSGAVEVLLDPNIRLPGDASLKLPLKLDTATTVETLQRLGALVYVTRAKTPTCHVLLRDALTDEDKKEATDAVERCLAFAGAETYLVMRFPDNPIANVRSLPVDECRRHAEKALQSPSLRYATLPRTVVLSVMPAGASEQRHSLIRAYENATEELAQQRKAAALLQATSRLFAELDRANVMDERLKLLPVGSIGRTCRRRPFCSQHSNGGVLTASA